MDLPLYTTVSRTPLSDLGSSAYQMFNHAIVLEQVMRQSGQDPQQIVFCQILLNLRDGKVTTKDWQHLMKQTPAQVQDLIPFNAALYLHPTIDAVVEYNLSRLPANGQPIATIKGVHTGPNASKASKAPPDEAAGLEPIICIAHEARVMLSTCGQMLDLSMVPWELSKLFATKQAKLHQIYQHQLWRLLTPTQVQHYQMVQFLSPPSAKHGQQLVHSAHVCNFR